MLRRGLLSMTERLGMPLKRLRLGNRLYVLTLIPLPRYNFSGFVLVVVRWGYRPQHIKPYGDVPCLPQISSKR